MKDEEQRRRLPALLGRRGEEVLDLLQEEGNHLLPPRSCREQSLTRPLPGEGQPMPDRFGVHRPPPSALSADACIVRGGLTSGAPDSLVPTGLSPRAHDAKSRGWGKGAVGR